MGISYKNIWIHLVFYTFFNMIRLIVSKNHCIFIGFRVFWWNPNLRKTVSMRPDPDPSYPHPHPHSHRHPHHAHHHHHQYCHHHQWWWWWCIITITTTTMKVTMMIIIIVFRPWIWQSLLKHPSQGNFLRSMRGLRPMTKKKRGQLTFRYLRL